MGDVYSAASAGLADGRVEYDQEKLTYHKALSIVTGFYSSATKEHIETPEKTKLGRSAQQAIAVKTLPSHREDLQDETIDLTILSSQETTAASTFGKDDMKNEHSAGDAVATILGLPEKVVIALAGLLKHLETFKLQSIFDMPKFFTPFAQRGHMLLNSNTLANLEIFRNQSDFKQAGSLFSLLDHTKTSFGQRLLRKWTAKPLLQLSALKERVNAIDELLNT